MTKAIYQSNYMHYLTGDFLNRIHASLRKVMPPLPEEFRKCSTTQARSWKESKICQEDKKIKME